MNKTELLKLAEEKIVGVRYRNGRFAVLTSNKCFSEDNGGNDISYWNEDLRSKFGIDYDVVKIYVFDITSIKLDPNDICEKFLYSGFYKKVWERKDKKQELIELIESTDVGRHELFKDIIIYYKYMEADKE